MIKRVLVQQERSGHCHHATENSQPLTSRTSRCQGKDEQQDTGHDDVEGPDKAPHTDVEQLSQYEQNPQHYQSTAQSHIANTRSSVPIIFSHLSTSYLKVWFMKCLVKWLHILERISAFLAS